MKSIVLLFAAFVACAYAQVSLPPGYNERYPHIKFSKQARHPRDVTWDKQIGNGKVFGTLGNDDQGLFGRGGYKQQIFNDDRGKLVGEAYGSRVLGPAGDSTNFGGKFDWSNKDAKAAIDLSKQIHGRSSLTATGEGIWNLDKNTRLSAGGGLMKEFGGRRPDVVLQAEIQHDF